MILLLLQFTPEGFYPEIKPNISRCAKCRGNDIRAPRANSPISCASLLGALNEEGTEFLEWLRDAVKRLVRIAQGVEDALDALAVVETALLVVWSLTGGSGMSRLSPRACVRICAKSVSHS